MNFVVQWFRQPQRLWLRRAFFQIHLWTGIALGLYIVLISLTGSAIVFRREVNAASVPVVKPTKERLSKEQLTVAIEKSYPGYKVESISQSLRPMRPSAVSLTGPKNLGRYFDPYTGRDLGDVDPIQLRIMEWLVDLHDNLLLRPSGKLINGVMSILVTFLVFAGIVIWWPGYRRVFRSMIVRKANWKSFNWQLHSAIGFWSLPIVLIWSITGIYFGFSSAFQKVVAFFAGGEYQAESFPDIAIGWMVRMHFGRFGGLGIRITWVILGLIPAILFFTGAIMWWNRSLRRMFTKSRTSANLPKTNYTLPRTEAASKSVGA